MPVLRLPAAAALLLTIAAASGSVNAQTSVPLQLEWQSPTGTKTCVFTTDSSGVTLVGGGPALKAKGAFAATDCPTATTPPPEGPVITNDISSTEIPSTTTAGATHTISWSATNAESCSYSGTFPSAVTGWPAGQACTGATDCATTRNVPITMPATAGTYTFTLTCSKAGFTPAVSSRSTTISSGPPPAGCIAPSGLTRQMSGKVSYNDGNDRNNIDLTRFENVFGHDNQGGASRLWPGTQNINQRIFIPRNNYVALQFTVPSNLHTDTRGQYRFEETAPTSSVMSITVSKACGDFSTTPTAPMTTKCILNGGALNSALTWGKTGLTARCQLEPGETYYLNIVHANLNTITTSGCSVASCSNTIQNQNMNPSSNPTIGWP